MKPGHDEQRFAMDIPVQEGPFFVMPEIAKSG
jgi:hypothetical protein